MLEKQLNQLFTLVTEADPADRAHFDSLKGWDRRVDAIIDKARNRLDQEKTDLVEVVLRLVKIPASKRDELAHRVWATVDGYETEFALLPPDDQHSIAEKVVAVKKAGRADIPIDNSSLYDGISMVSAEDLDQLIQELHDAGMRMDALTRGHLYPKFVDVTGAGFSDYRKELENDVEVAARLINVARSRKRAEKAMRREPPAS